MPFVHSKVLCTEPHWKNILKIKSDYSQNAACAENTEKDEAVGLTNMTHNNGYIFIDY